MSTFNGDFLGFSFNGVSSSTLGLTRVSDGSRYNEDLLPASQDKTVQVPGGHGTYYFGSYYTQRTFSVQVAFDNVTENQFRLMRQTFQQDKMGKLIFDERPEKYYMAKSNGAQSLKYVCFDIDGQNIYKGEGTLNFISYYPFAMSEPIQVTLPSSNPIGQTKIPINNNGDLISNWKLKVPVTGMSTLNSGKIELYTTSSSPIGSLSVENITLQSGTNELIFDSKTRLISSNNGTVYNSYIDEGNFFTLPLNISYLSQNFSSDLTLTYQKEYF